MKKRYMRLFLAAAVFCLLATGCAGTGTQESAAVTEANAAGENASEEAERTGETPAAGRESWLEDGIYTAEFETDSSMFHVSEACGGKGTLTVENREMTIHISLGSKNIVNLYPGLAADAEKEGAAVLAPTVDSVTYSDGWTEEVYGFDVPVPSLDQEFDLALLGKKGTWYDHKVKVSHAVLAEKDGAANEAAGLEDGTYSVDVTLEGGSGRAGIDSPAVLTVKEGVPWGRIQWSSPNYDYMEIGETKYLPVNTEGNSVFELPVRVFDEAIAVSADTTAMGTPHEIEYTLTFHSDSVKKEETESDSSLPLTYTGSLKLDYAEEFAVDLYDGGYALISISDGSRFLVVPEGAAVPEGLDAGITVLMQPVDRIYLAATAVMDMIASLDAADAVRLSGTKEDGWYIQAAKDAMASGEMLYAGKYNMPDYERIMSEGCDLAIESTMILHSPEVKERLEEFGIPVLVDRSSYEGHPLGRTEWVKLYGALLGREEEAEQVYEEQKAALDAVSVLETEQKTVAFFYITSNGAVSVRKSGDYVPKMIELAGGTYVFSDLGDDTASSSVTMQMEEFYARARDADFLIYNSAVDRGLHSREELLEKSPLLQDFKAFSQGNVFCTTQNLYQESVRSGTFILDLNRMLTMEDEGNESFAYLFRLE